MRHWFGLIIALAVSLPAAVWACTTFGMNQGDEFVVAKSYDWGLGDGLVITNKSGVAKRALPSLEGTPAQWTSKYASVTFNQYGRELPNGGMNEKGLVVEVMWLDEARYEKPDKRPTVTELQWIQYQLDNFASVDEVRKNLRNVRVSAVHAKVHYLVCDAGGTCASVEHVGGKLVIASSRALTNDTQKVSKRYLRRKKAPTAKSTSSLDRFVRASKHSEATGASVDDAFAALDSVRGPTTQWQIVYQPSTLTAFFRTRTNRSTKQVRLADFGATCKTEVRLLDIDFDRPGEASKHFRPYTKAANADVLDRTLSTLADKIPPKLRAQVAGYPDGLRCSN